MLQRIQTVYLLIASALLASLYFIPSLSFIYPDGELYVSASKADFADAGGDVETLPSNLLTFTVGVSALITLLCVFLFKNRKVQERMVNLSTVITLLNYGVFAYLWYLLNRLPGATFNPSASFGVLFPLIAIVLQRLARRGIRKDEDLVKSVDRIR